MNSKNQLEGPILEISRNPNKLVFLLHGYGDTGDNFVSIAHLINEKENKINFFAPNAPSPIPQYPLGRQWFDLYPNGINFNQAGQAEIEILKNDCLSSLELIREYINSKCSVYDLTYKDIYVIGFSQGAMMTFELGKYLDQAFTGCALLSGRILPSHINIKKNFIKTPILVTHGDKDSVLEPKYFKETCKILKNNDFYFESHLIKNNEHTISTEVINLIKKFIKKCMV